MKRPNRAPTIVHVYPPIPDRSSDWTAYYDEEGPVGWGATPEAAVEDLEWQMDDGEES
jgi:hypothetical protein